MAESILAFGVEKLWDILVRESEPRQGVGEQLAELKRALNLLSSFLKDADAKKHRSKVVRNCVEEIKEIIYDWEDTVETFLLRQNLGQTNGSKMSIETLAFATTIYDGEDTLETLFFSQNLKSGSKKSIKKFAFDVAGISKRIFKVIREMQSFGIQQIITDGWNMQPLPDKQREMRQTFPQDYESDFVGLEANVKKLVGYLVEEDTVEVVSITGMGGLGKTTLARQVFNHEAVKCQFDGLAWVRVSQEFTLKNVWQKILVDFRPKEEAKNIWEMEEDTLRNELFRLMETSKSLIVLDDIWKEEDWDRIKPIFPPRKGWKVLLTSRNDCVAVRTTYISLKPECLNNEDSWTLFQRIAFPIKDASEFKIDEEMEEMGKQMIKHCGGLPLAIKVLGGFLAAKYTVHDWKRLSENIASHLMGGRNDSRENVLSLSFEELPIYLKNCFLYLAHFPEDHSIDVEALSYYWAAEGLFESRHYDKETIRDVGDICIEELVKRNMVISEREAKTSRFETCHLHVMMREICLLKAKEENFLQIISSHPPTADFESLVTSRRFVSHYPTTLDVERDIDNPKIRSLVVVSHHLWGNWKLTGSSFKRLELLRTLDLFKGEFQGEELPYSIGELIHLRFLSLKDVKVIHLPSSLGHLKLLIYLNIKVHMESIFVPNVLMGMRELRYLALPYDMHEKTKLELSSLVKLETLKNFTTENSSVKDLRGMVRLKTLTLKLTDETSIETLSPSIGGLRHLEDLRIQDNRRRRTKEEGLVWDFVHLKKLKLKIYMPILLKEELLPSQLTSLDLFGCRLKEDPMPILEKLLHLYEVKLGDQSLCGRRMVCSNGGFPILQRLEFSGLQEWEEWIVEEGSMPLLHTLHIWDCPKLKKVPDRLRLYEFKESIVEEGSMPLLHTLHIQDCPKLKEVLDGIRFIYSLKNQSIETNRLDLREYRLEDDPMPILEKMFHLYDVELGDQSFCGRRMVCSSGGFPKLQRLTFNGLEEWEEWIVEEGSMPLLQSLEIWECPKLKDFPNGLHFPSHLITIYLNNCALEEDPMPILEKLFQLKELYLSQCFNGRRMVCSGGGFPQLHNLRLFELRELEKWIVEEGSMPLLHTLEIGWCPKLKELPDGQHFPSHLTTIYLCSCGLEENPFPILEKLVQLKEVRVSKCLSGRILVCSASGFPQLEKLYVDELEELEEWIIEEGSMPLLRSLNISNCPELKELPDGQHFPSHLTTISLSLCGLEEDPMPILEKLVQLEEVKLSQCFTGKRMVCSGGGFPQLQKLKLYGLDEWKVWIVEKGSMPLLHILEIWGCPKVKELPDGLQFPSHLTTISLSWCGLEEDPMPILEKLVQLKEVILSKCFSGRKMVCSPHGFPQLQKLCLDELEELEEWIVEEGSMPLLQYLDITKCPNVSVAGSVDFLNFLSTSFQSARFEDVFSSISSSHAKHRKQNSSPFDDLVGNNLRKRENKDSSVFDDLIPGFGRTSSPPPKRSTSETSQSQKPPNQTAKTPSNLVEEDPFVVLEESPLTPREPSTGGFTDPLEEIGKFNSRKTDHSSVHGGESSGSYHSKKVSFDDVLEPQNTSAPPPTNSDGSFESSDDVWLTLSEIPLFTQPTSTPPPARPPPPRPTRPVKKKVNEPSIPSSANHSHVPSSARASANCPTASQMDELDDFSMGRNQTAANGYPDPPSGEDSDVTSAAVASAAAMKDAMDKAEAKFRHAKERREKENLKASRSREGDHTENYDSRERELREKQVRLDRERVEKEAEIEKAQEREREERQREQKIIERERERLLARQAVERATEACERAATKAHAKVQRAAVGKATDARERAVRAAVQRAHAEARERAAAGAREKAEKAAAEARERANAEALEKEAKVRAERAAEARGRASAQAKAKQQQENNNDLDSFNSVSRPSSAPQQRTNPPDPFQDSWNKGGSFESSRASSPVPSGASENLRKPTSAKNIVDDLSSLFGASASQSGGFQDVGGETE